MKHPIATTLNAFVSLLLGIFAGDQLNVAISKLSPRPDLNALLSVLLSIGAVAAMYSVIKLQRESAA